MITSQEPPKYLSGLVSHQVKIYHPYIHLVQNCIITLSAN